MGGGAGRACPLNCSMKRRICSGSTRQASRGGGEPTGAGAVRYPVRCTGCAVRRIGAATDLAPTGAGRGCCGRGRCGFGCKTGGAFSDSDESLSICLCSLLQPLANTTTAAMINQTRVSMSACFTMLTGGPGLTNVLAGD